MAANDFTQSLGTPLSQAIRECLKEDDFAKEYAYWSSVNDLQAKILQVKDAEHAGLRDLARKMDSSTNTIYKLLDDEELVSAKFDTILRYFVALGRTLRFEALPATADEMIRQHWEQKASQPANDITFGLSVDCGNLLAQSTGQPEAWTNQAYQMVGLPIILQNALAA